MKIRKKLLIPLLLLCSTIFGQEIKLKPKNIVGVWKFTKTVDKNNQEVKFIYQTYPNGKKMKIVANGPDITIIPNGTYQMKFTEKNIDKGNWKIVSENEIEYEMVIPKNSRQEKLIIQTQKIFPNKKWKKNNNGNFIDASTNKIIELNENEMKVEYRKNYFQIYKKVEKE